MFVLGLGRLFITAHYTKAAKRKPATREKGSVLIVWGGGKDANAARDFIAPHDIWLDSRGDLYVGEVTISAAGARVAATIIRSAQG